MWPNNSNTPFIPGWFDDFSAKNVSSNILDIDLQENLSGTEPVTLAQAKAQCRMDFTDDDVPIGMLITAARQAIEQFCSISLLKKTITLTFDLQAKVEIPYGPIQSITSFVDGDGNVVDSSAYRIYGKRYQTIEPVSFSMPRAVLTYIAGYDGIKFLVEQNLILAMLTEIAFRYEHKGDDADTRKSVNPGICESSRVLAQPFIRASWV